MVSLFVWWLHLAWNFKLRATKKNLCVLCYCRLFFKNACQISMLQWQPGKDWAFGIKFFLFSWEKFVRQLGWTLIRCERGEKNYNWRGVGGDGRVVNVQSRTSVHKGSVLNPLWGHRSISIDSDLGVLQPYFLVVMVTAASPFFAFDAVDALKRPLFYRKSGGFGPLKLRFPSSPRPAVELYAVLVLVSGLLSWKWTVCQRSIPAAI